MTRYENQDAAPYGLYFSTRPLDVRFVGAEGERIDGVPGATYRHVPTPLAVALAPVLGGLFVIAFPFVIFAAAITGVARLLGVGAREAATSTARVATTRYAASAAWIDGKGAGEAEDAEAPAADAELADLEAEVAERREDG